MRVLLVGVGGVGGLIGAHLIRSGAQTAMLARGAHLDAIRARGLTVSSPKGEMLLPLLYTVSQSEPEYRRASPLSTHLQDRTIHIHA